MGWDVLVSVFVSHFCVEGLHVSAYLIVADHSMAHGTDMGVLRAAHCFVVPRVPLLGCHVTPLLLDAVLASVRLLLLLDF